MCAADNQHELKLICFMLDFPMPKQLKEILQEQVACSTYTVERYDDCWKILFEKPHAARVFPAWTPHLLQGCELVKDNGPFVCQLFVEQGYVVQFEVVDMGRNKIDWEYFWRLKPVFEVDYDINNGREQ